MKKNDYVIINICNMQTINSEQLQQLCTEFINDDDTIMGMQNNWYDMLVREIPVELNKNDIMQALQTTEDKYIVHVFNKYMNDSFDIFVAISNNNVSIATKSWLLW